MVNWFACHMGDPSLIIILFQRVEVSILPRFVKTRGTGGSNVWGRFGIPSYLEAQVVTTSCCMAFNSGQLHFHKRSALGGLIH